MGDDHRDSVMTPVSDATGTLQRDSSYEAPTASSLVSGAAVVSAVLAQFTENFLLNDSPHNQADRLNPRSVEGRTLAIVGHEPRRRDTLVERVHQSRVSVRRIRSTIGIFGRLLSPDWPGGLSEELAWYGGVLGVSRDLDVLRTTLISSPGLEEESSLRSTMLDSLGQLIENALAQHTEHRNSSRYEALVDTMVEMSTSPRFASAAYRDAHTALIPQVARSWHDVGDIVNAAKKESNIRNLHRLRIRLKRLQYSCETIALVEGRRVSRVARGAQALQTKLGTVHDEAVAVAWLQTFGEGHPEFAVSIDDLLSYHDGAMRTGRRGWRDDMKELERRWHRWYERAHT